LDKKSCVVMEKKNYRHLVFKTIYALVEELGGTWDRKNQKDSDES